MSGWVGSSASPCEIPPTLLPADPSVQSQAKVVVQSRILWSGLEGAWNCAMAPSNPSLQIGCSEVGSVAGIVGPEPKSCFELGDRVVRLTSLDECQTQIVVGVGVVGLRLNHAAKSSGRALCVSVRCKTNPSWVLASIESGCNRTAACNSWIASPLCPRSSSTRRDNSEPETTEEKAALRSSTTPVLPRFASAATESHPNGVLIGQNSAVRRGLRKIARRPHQPASLAREVLPAHRANPPFPVRAPRLDSIPMSPTSGPREN